MKKIFLTLSVLLAVSLIYYFSTSSKPNNVLQKPAVASAAPIKAGSLIEQVKEYPGLQSSNLSQTEAQGECREALEAIETLPLKTLIYDLTNKKLKFNAGCLFETKNEIALLNGFPEVCEKIENGVASEDCVQKLFFFKALRIHRATKNEDLDNLSTEIIINKLIGLLADNAFSSVDGLKEIRQVGSKLYERLPNSEAAAKAAAIGYMAAESLSPEEKKTNDKILDDARNKFPANGEIYEMDLVRKKLADEESFKAEVNRYYATNPKAPIAIYYMGCVKWSESLGDQARGFFKTAAEKMPADERFVNTYKVSLSLKPPEKICAVRINFDPEKF